MVCLRSPFTTILAATVLQSFFVGIVQADSECEHDAVMVSDEEMPFGRALQFCVQTPGFSMGHSLNPVHKMAFLIHIPKAYDTGVWLHDGSQSKGSKDVNFAACFKSECEGRFLTAEIDEDSYMVDDDDDELDDCEASFSNKRMKFSDAERFCKNKGSSLVDKLDVSKIALLWKVGKLQIRKGIWFNGGVQTAPLTRYNFAACLACEDSTNNTIPDDDDDEDEEDDDTFQVFFSPTKLSLTKAREFCKSKGASLTLKSNKEAKEAFKDENEGRFKAGVWFNGPPGQRTNKKKSQQNFAACVKIGNSTVDDTDEDDCELVGFFSPKRLTFEQAEDFCVENGGALTEKSNSAEKDILKDVNEDIFASGIWFTGPKGKRKNKKRSQHNFAACLKSSCANSTITDDDDEEDCDELEGFFSPGRLTFEEAEEFCQANGGSLTFKANKADKAILKDANEDLFAAGVWFDGPKGMRKNKRRSQFNYAACLRSACVNVTVDDDDEEEEDECEVIVFFSEEKMNWNDAKEFCLDGDGDLTDKSDKVTKYALALENKMIFDSGVWFRGALKNKRKQRLNYAACLNPCGTLSPTSSPTTLPTMSPTVAPTT